MHLSLRVAAAALHCAALCCMLPPMPSVTTAQDPLDMPPPSSSCDRPVDVTLFQMLPDWCHYLQLQRIDSTCSACHGSAWRSTSAALANIDLQALTASSGLTVKMLKTWQVHGTRLFLVCLQRAKASAEPPLRNLTAHLFSWKQSQGIQCCCP